MSYTFVICAVPIPETDDAAWEHVENLIDREDEDTGLPPNPAISAVLEKLASIYPCICDLSDDEVDNGVWCSGPLLPCTAHAVRVEGIVFSKVDEAFPVIVREVTTANLSLLDWQTGVIHRPLNARPGPANAPKTDSASDSPIRRWWSFLFGRKI